MGKVTAADALRNYQVQCDPEGIEVQVSRQALEEVLRDFAKYKIALEEISIVPDQGGAGETLTYVVSLARKALGVN